MLLKTFLIPNKTCSCNFITIFKAKEKRKQILCTKYFWASNIDTTVDDGWNQLTHN